MFFLVRYSKSLEEGSFRNRTADFLWMLLFGAALLVAAAPFVNIQFLGSSLSFMMVRGRARAGWEARGVSRLRVVARAHEGRLRCLTRNSKCRHVGCAVGWLQRSALP